jgi:competence protein ComEC
MKRFVTICLPMLAIGCAGAPPATPPSALAPAAPTPSGSTVTPQAPTSPRSTSASPEPQSTKASPEPRSTNASPEPPPKPSTFVVHVADVGTGLGILVEGSDFVLVYDGGSNDDDAVGANNRFLAYLRASKPSLKTIDELVLSHPHKDHVELLPDLFDAFAVKRVWDSGAAAGECQYEHLIALIQTHKVPYRSATADAGRHPVAFKKTCPGLQQSYDLDHGQRIEAGLTVPLGKSAAMHFLHAEKTTKSDLNDNSLVVRLDLGKKRVLLMGDAGAGGRDEPTKAPKPSSIEAQLLAERRADVKADVLVVGHHGSKTGSRKVFIDAVAPALSVISSGPMKYNKVQLPDLPIVAELEQQGALFRTDKDDPACAKNPAKIGRDNDGKPGGCDNVRITLTDRDPPKAEYWTQAD